MAGHIEGERPHGELTSQQSKLTEQHKPHQEGGNGTPGLPPTIHERAKPPPESQERQLLPSVWDYLERRAMLNDRYPSGVKRRVEPRPDKFYSELRVIKPLLDDLNEQGTPRDKLILNLFSTISGGLVLLSQKDVQQFRSRLETMSEEEITKEILRQEEMRRPAFHPGVGLGEVITKQKDKHEQSG